MRDVYIAAVGMIPFGRYYDLGIKQLTARCVADLILRSPVAVSDIQAAWFSNTGWGIGVGQHCIRGQVALAPLGFQGIPIMNVENACASGSSAFYGACLAIRSGEYDVALAIGTEKTAVSPDAPREARKASFDSFLAGTDIEVTRQYIESLRASNEAAGGGDAKPSGGAKEGGAKDRSPFMDFYAIGARQHMKTYGTTQEQLAIIAAKNHNHGALNPYAQYRFTTTPAEVLKDREVAWPMTRSHCATMGDGSAAAILVSGDYLRKLGDIRAVKVRATVLGSTRLDWPGSKRAAELAHRTYERAGVSPDDIDLAEVHDATAFGELAQTENLGFCGEGEGGPYAATGATALGGKRPINPSGGLESRGHPIGASGLAMIAECFFQLRGEADKRQVQRARLAMIENGGGFLGQGDAAIQMHILEAPSRA